MKYASLNPCYIFRKPKSTKYAEGTRIFQGCPTIAVTRGGRIYLGWYAGGTKEPHMNNYNLLIYSDDKGATWSDPLLVIPSSYEMNVHALDIQLFIDPMGALHVCWVQNNTAPYQEDFARPSGKPWVTIDGYSFCDYEHSEWEILCEDPDAEEPVFSAPRYIFPGFLRCKPTFLENGDWLCFGYDQLTKTYGYSISTDQGKSYTHYYGGKKISTVFDETMAYQREDGSLRMFARCLQGELAESYSYDNGRTWEDAKLSGITHSDTRFFIQKLPSGRVMLIHNDHPKDRSHITVKLSEDDGRTWKYSKCIDSRNYLSYPDADLHDGVIYLTYDRGRGAYNEILFASFTEEDVIANNDIAIQIASKSPVSPRKKDVMQAIEEHKLIAILRNIPNEKLIPTAEALYAGGIRLLEITFAADGSKNQEVQGNIKRLTEHFQEKMLIGAGTVVSEEQVRLTKMAGGTFVISPNTNRKVIFESHICGLVSIPGAYTPSEICKAQESGADFVKLFPAVDLGPKYVKAVKAPLNHIKILAVGGINENNMQEYLQAGICGFGVGSNIVDQKLVEAEDYGAITALAEKYVAVISSQESSDKSL